MQTHIDVPLLPEPIDFEFEISIAKLRKYKSPGISQISAGLNQLAGKILGSDTHKPISFIWNYEESPQKWNESIIAPIHKMGDKCDGRNVVSQNHVVLDITIYFSFHHRLYATYVNF
jgi:hypothetical protein